MHAIAPGACVTQTVDWENKSLGALGRSHLCQYCGHTPSVTFWHLPPNSARFGYAIDGPLFTSAQLTTDTVSALGKVWVLIRLWEPTWCQCMHINMRHILQVQGGKKRRVPS